MVNSRPRMIHGIDDKIWKEFKVWCLRENKKVGEGLNDILQDFLKRHGGKK